MDVGQRVEESEHLVGRKIGMVVGSGRRFHAS
jgi:hypothetical protein